jgi:hypothetical protein
MHNTRLILALRALADRLELGHEWVGESVNRALSEVEGNDDAERLLTVLLDGTRIDAR